jgi:hypothetical protein
MSSFIKFFDSKGFLIALTSLDGIIKYTTQAGQVTFQNFSPTGVMGQSISLVLKTPQLLDFCISANESIDISFEDSQIIELETIHNTFITAHVSPTNTSYASPMDARDASSPEQYACQPISPTSSPSSLAQAFLSQSSQLHDINADVSPSCDEEMSFNECFDDAAVECR